MDSQALMKIGVALAAVAVAYKFAPSALVKTAAVAVGGVIVAKQLPYVRDALA
ncbi:MAG TPA: hypothetical protein P5024_12240 [Burkholderiaceae bacterium]|nr:hypothetical protein [Burkholderiaceae bacterium]